MTNEPTPAAIEDAWQNESVFDLVTKMDEIGEPIPDPRHRAMAMVRFGYQKGYEAAKAADWVKCEDRLPDEKGPYLFTFAFHAVSDDMVGRPGSDNPYYADGRQFGGKRVVEELYYADDCWYLSEDDYQSDPDNGMPFSNSQYIAWMPLPQPYTGE